MLSTSTSSSRKTSSIKSVEFSLYFTASFIASRKALGKNEQIQDQFEKNKKRFALKGTPLQSLDG